MAFQPRVHDALIIGDITYRFAQYPAAGLGYLTVRKADRPRSGSLSPEPIGARSRCPNLPIARRSRGSC